MAIAQNDNAPDTRLPVPLWRDPATWFGWVMVAATFAFGLWRAGAFSQ
jgi:hypothetical protein